MAERTRVLVTYASKMGSTQEIAEVIGNQLKSFGMQVTRGSTWLVHSGPCGEGARDEQVQAPKAVERVIVPLGLSAPVTFGGRLDVEHATGPVSRWMGAEGPLSGDFRDWDRIRAWASDIAHKLDGATAGTQQ
jgi:menaquinone-dependent protoporphyrinogen oxidase